MGAAAPPSSHVATVAQPKVLTGQDAFTDYTKEAPGTFRKLTVADLPAPYATKGVDAGSKLVPRPSTIPGWCGPRRMATCSWP